MEPNCHSNWHPSPRKKYLPCSSELRQSSLQGFGPALHDRCRDINRNLFSLPYSNTHLHLFRPRPLRSHFKIIFQASVSSNALPVATDTQLARPLLYPLKLNVSLGPGSFTFSFALAPAASPRSTPFLGIWD